MNKFLSAIRNGFGFLSTIPVGITMEGIENLMKHIYIFPAVGAVLGIIISIIGFAASTIFPPLVVSFIIIILIYYFTGFNHIDGLADFGDGIAAHGTKEKKISAMRDTAIGTGGVIFCTISFIGIFISLVSIQELDKFMLLPYSLVVAEISAKQAMVTVAAFGQKLHGGFGAITIENTRMSDFLIGLGFSGIVSIAFLGLTGLEALIISQIAGLLVLNTANRHFGGVSGDVIGAANEIGRLAVLFYIGGLGWMLL